jgi:hypothetical protein
MSLRSAVIGFYLFLVASVLAAQAPPAAGPPTGRIAGRILQLPQSKNLTARIESVELYVGDSGRLAATANVDAEGRFALDQVPAGRVRLNPVFRVGDQETKVTLPNALMLPGIVRAGEVLEADLFGKGRPITGQIAVPPPLKTENSRVVLQLLEPPTRVVLGRDGKPVPRLDLQLQSLLTADKLEAMLDAEGRFKIEGVREGNYRIVVHSPDSATPVVFQAYIVRGAPHVEFSKLTVPFMAGGASEKPLDLGVMKFAPLPGQSAAAPAVPVRK